MCLQPQHAHPQRHDGASPGHPDSRCCNPGHGLAVGHQILQPRSNLLVQQPRQGQGVRHDLLVCQQTAAPRRAASWDHKQPAATWSQPLQPWSSLLVCQPRQGQRVRDDLLVCQQTAALSRAASRDCQQPAATRSQPVQPWSSLLVRQSRQGQGVRHDLLVLVEVDVNTSVTAKE